MPSATPFSRTGGVAPKVRSCKWCGNRRLYIEVTSIGPNGGPLVVRFYVCDLCDNIG